MEACPRHQPGRTDFPVHVGANSAHPCAPDNPLLGTMTVSTSTLSLSAAPNVGGDMRESVNFGAHLSGRRTHGREFKRLICMPLLSCSGVGVNDFIGLWRQSVALSLYSPRAVQNGFSVATNLQYRRTGENPADLFSHSRHGGATPVGVTRTL